MSEPSESSKSGEESDHQDPMVLTPPVHANPLLTRLLPTSDLKPSTTYTAITTSSVGSYTLPVPTVQTTSISTTMASSGLAYVPVTTVARVGTQSWTPGLTPSVPLPTFPIPSLTPLVTSTPHCTSVPRQSRPVLPGIVNPRVT